MVINISAIMSDFTHPLTLESPQTGEHMILRRSYYSPGERFRFTWTLAPGKGGPAEHRHDDETHEFDVVSGKLSVWVDGVRHDLGPGDTLAIPHGAAHRFKNFGPEPAVVEVANDGPGFENFCVPLAIEGRRRGSDELGPGMIGLVLVQAVSADNSKPTWRSRPIWEVVRVVAWVARLFGVEPLPPVRGWDREDTRETKVAA